MKIFCIFVSPRFCKGGGLVLELEVNGKMYRSIGLIVKLWLLLNIHLYSGGFCSEIVRGIRNSRVTQL